MNNTRYTTTRSTPNATIGNTAQDLVAFGRSQGWDLPVLGHAPLPKGPTYINEWMIVPAHLDNTALPPRAQDRMKTILSAGIRPAGWLVVHEAPTYLPSGEEQTDHQSPTPFHSAKNRQLARKAFKVLGTTLGALALATGTLVLAIVAILAFLPVVLIAGAILIDPILVAVTEDGYWVEIDRWDV